MLGSEKVPNRGSQSEGHDWQDAGVVTNKPNVFNAVTIIREWRTTSAILAEPLGTPVTLIALLGQALRPVGIASLFQNSDFLVPG